MYVLQTRKGRVLGKDEIKAALVERLGDLAMRQVRRLTASGLLWCRLQHREMQRFAVRTASW